VFLQHIIGYSCLSSTFEDLNKIVPMLVTKNILTPVGILLLMAAVVVSCEKKVDANTSFQRKPLPLGNIEGVIVHPTILQSSVTASGSLLPLEQTELHSEVSGRVISMHLPEGKKVAAGTVLVKLFDEDLQTQVRKSEAQLAIARTTAQRLKGLLDVQGASRQEYDVAELQIKNIEAEIDLLKVKIRQTEIRAPYDGMIGLRQISPGAYITPATPIATIRDDRRLRLDFSVPEKYGALIKTGQTVHFKVDGSQRSYTATVNASEQSVNASTRDLQLRALVNDQSSELTPGRFAEVDLSLTSRPQALMIPSEAIIPQAKDKKVVVGKSGKAQFVNVTTGVRQAGMVEILSGLNAGDTIVTTGLLFLKPNAEFTFSKIIPGLK
jgi:membrane fusion protein (multidrug efflux system)